MYWNIRNLVNKVDELSLICQKHNLDIICLGEHWCKDNEIASIVVPDFKLASSFCRQTWRGGSAIFVRNDIDIQVFDRFDFLAETLVFEISAVSLVIDTTQFVIVSLYRIPHSDGTLFLHKLHKLFILCNSLNLHLILGADLNINVIDPKEKLLNSFTDLLDGFGLMLSTYEITRPSESGGSCIDNFITPIHKDHRECKVLNEHLSDHFALVLTLKLDVPTRKIRDTNTVVRSLGDNSALSLHTLLRNHNWFDVYSQTTAESKLNIFLQGFLSLINEAFPLKKSLKSNKKDKGWFTVELAGMKKTCDNLYYLAKHSSNKSSKLNYSNFKSKYKKALRNAKLNYNSEKIAKATNKSKVSWDLIKSTFNSSLRSEISLNSRETNLNSDMFNSYFINSINSLASPGNSINKCKNYFGNIPLPLDSLNFTLSHFKVEDVHKAILRLSNSNSLDLFYLNSKIVKLSANYISEVLQHIFNVCVDESIFPNVLKLSKIIPIHKKGSKTSYDSYRPISLVPVLSKVFEYLISDQLTSYFEENCLFSSRQFGFRVGKNTCTAVTDFVKQCYSALENKKYHSSRLFDMTKAFDTVHHDILVEKLKFYGCTGKFCKLISSYLHNRNQTVFFDGTFSKFLTVKYGVPQGSILGPLLFIIYINDLPYNISNDQVKSYLFADDLALSVTTNCSSENNALQDKNMIFIKSWCSANGLHLNENKTQDIHVSFKPGHSNSVVTFLGVKLESGLGWNSHTDHIAKKMSIGVFMIRRLQGRINLESLKDIYYAHIHSHLFYCNILWAHHSSTKRIFTLQKMALRTLAGVKKDTHCRPLFLNFKILTVYSVYVFQCLLFIKNNLKDHRDHTSLHNYCTRGRHALINNSTLYSKTYKSFYFNSIKLFNFLPTEIKALSDTQFKTTIKSILHRHCLYSIDEFYRINFLNLNCN